MKEEYYIKTDNGSTVPKYKHSSIESAIVEARRLKKVANCKKVEILQVVGVLEDVTVPVTKIEEKWTFIPSKETGDDLPF